jgi:hypothetical protein
MDAMLNNIRALNELAGVAKDVSGSIENMLNFQVE